MGSLVKESWSAYAALGLLLCFLPPTRVLGYESAFVVVVFTSAFGVFWLLGASRVRVAVSLALPLVFLLINALFVKNCNLGEGIAWYLVLVPAHAMLALGLARRGRLPYLALVVVLAALMIRGPIVGPSLRAYSPLLGFFAGSLYDEALPIPTPLYWHSLMVALLAAALWRRSFVFGVLAFGIFAAGNRLGFRVSESDLLGVLSRSVATEHLVLHFAPDGAVERRIADIWPEAERTAVEVAQPFGDDPRLREEPTHVYLYDDADTKERLLGARHTLFTRPWSPELHVLYSGSEQIPALGHELVHAFARVWGEGPLGLPAKASVLVDLGLVEGVAVALSHEDALPPDLAMASLKKLGKLPNLRRLFGTSGFYLDSATRAYTAAGAFIAWIIRTRGIEPVREAYRRGSMGDVDALATEYEAYLDTVALDEATTRAFAEAFKEKPLYARVCGREFAKRRVVAARAVEGQRFEEASKIYEQMRADDPGDASLALPLLDLERRRLNAGRTNTYDEALKALLASNDVSEPQKQRLREQQADRAVQLGRLDEAASALTAAMEGAVRDDDIRRLQVKKALLDRLDVASVFATLDGSLSESRALVMLAEAFHRAPLDPIINYLYARRLVNIGDTALALSHMTVALAGELPHLVRVETLRLRFEALVRLRQRSGFEAAVAAMEGAAETPAEITMSERARDKARFYLRHEAW